MILKSYRVEQSVLIFRNFIQEHFISNPKSDLVASVFQTADDGLLIFGCIYQSDFWVTKLISSKKIKWKENFGSKDQFGKGITYYLGEAKYLGQNMFIGGGYIRNNIQSNNVVIKDDFWLVKIQIINENDKGSQ